MLEDRTKRAAVAAGLGLGFLFIARSYVYFDGYWSFVADAVVFLLGTGIAFYGLSTFAR